MKAKKYSTVIFMLGFSVYAANYSGRIIDFSRKGFSGVEVRLSSSQAKTISDADGYWNIDLPTTMIKNREKKVSPTISNINGRLNICFGNNTASGTNCTSDQMHYSIFKHAAFRSSGSENDTLIYSYNGKVFLRDTVRNISNQEYLRYFDTTVNADITYGYIRDVRDSSVYRTINLFGKYWMAQNLNYYISGSTIFDPINETPLWRGRLYSWSQALELNDSCNEKKCTSLVKSNVGICPLGWHIPSRKDWNILYDSIGYTYHKNNAETSSKMRSKYFWPDAQKGVDVYGFNAVPSASEFILRSSYLSSTEYADINAYSPIISLTWVDPSYGWDTVKAEKKYLRCIQD